MLPPIRIGVLGCARIALRSLIPEISRHEAFELAAIASRTPERSELIARQYDCRAMGYDALVVDPSIDAIYVPLPPGLHAAWITRCLEAGKHVLSEKSLGCTLAEVESMVALAEARGRLLMENFQFRFHSQHRRVKELLAGGELGEIRCFRSSFGFPPFADGSSNIRYQKELGGGSLLDAGAYTLKATSFMQGKNFRVKAATLMYSDRYDVDLGGAAYLENEDGLVSEVAFGFDHFYQCNYEIWGSKGKLTSRRAFTAAPGFTPEIVLETPDGTKSMSLPADNHFANMLTHFAATIERGDFAHEHAQNLEQARLIQQVADLANK